MDVSIPFGIGMMAFHILIMAIKVDEIIGSTHFYSEYHCWALVCIGSLGSTYFFML